jgi:hypothetical protein
MNGSMDDIMNNRRIVKNGENIHDYLHANVHLETKKLQLLKESWEDEDEVLTFKPIIPAASKQLLLRYQKNRKQEMAMNAHKIVTDENDEHFNNRSLELGFSSFDDSGVQSKIIVSEMGLESYLTLPPSERLSKAETLCRVVKPGQNESQSRQSKRNKANGDSGSGSGGETNVKGGGGSQHM